MSVRATSAYMDAWNLREFVRALDEAGIPDQTRIDAHHSNDTRVFTGLSARHTISKSLEE